jgi:adenylate cyclase class 2
MFEAEIKYLADGPLPQPGEPLGEVVSADCYFDTPDGAFYASGQELRLRQAAGRTVLTSKRPPFEAATQSKEEWETTVADAEAMRAILTGLGYVVRLGFSKHRRLFRARHQGLSLSVAVATVDFSPDTFVEIEHLAASRAEALAALPIIRDFAAGLGLTRECPTSYTDLYLAGRTGPKAAS